MGDSQKRESLDGRRNGGLSGVRSSASGVRAAAATTTLFPPSSSVFCWPEWPARKKVGGKEEEEASLPLPHPWENLAIFSQRRRKGGKDRCVEEEEVGKHTGQQRRTRRRYSIGEVGRTDWRKRRHKKKRLREWGERLLLGRGRIKAWWWGFSHCTQVRSGRGNWALEPLFPRYVFTNTKNRPLV